MANTAETVYKCTNTSCRMGRRDEPGHFTGGITEEQLIARLDEDERKKSGVGFGDGYCPSCGMKGTKIETTFTPLVGDDPYQPVHDIVGAHVEDIDHPLMADNAQEVLETAVAIIEDDSNPVSKPETAVDHALSAVGI